MASLVPIGNAINMGPAKGVLLHLNLFELPSKHINRLSKQLPRYQPNIVLNVKHNFHINKMPHIF